MAQIAIRGFNSEKRLTLISIYCEIEFNEPETVSAKYNVENIRAELEEIVQRYELSLVDSYSHKNNELFNVKIQ